MAIRLSEREYAKLMGKKQPKTNKYNAKRTTIDGITFASKFEAEYYSELLLRQKAGEIKSFTCQKVFVLQDGFRYEGKRYSAIKYYADFVVTYPDGREEVIDTKGHKTQLYNIKKKLLLAKYPDIKFKEVYK